MSDNNYIDKPHIYKIVNKINGKFYYGVHNGKNTDKYMGSGTTLKNAYKKYGIENFSKEILLWFDTIEEAYEYEAIIVTEEMINNPMCYNMQTGGLGGRTVSEETLKRMSESKKGENNPFYGKNLSYDHKQKISESNKYKIRSDKTKQKMRKPKSDSHKEKMSYAKITNKVVKCPYCTKDVNDATKNTWHFKNCKLNPNKLNKLNKIK